MRGWWWGALLLPPVLACGTGDTGLEERPLAPGGSGGGGPVEVPPPVIHGPPAPLATELLGPELGAPRDALDLSFDQGGGLWIAARDGLFVRPPGAHFFDPITASDGLPRAEIHAVGGLAAGTALVSFRGGEPPRLVRIDEGGGIAVEEAPLSPLVARFRPVETEDGRFLVAATGAGLAVLDAEGTVRGTRTLPAPAPELWDVAVTPAGDAWVGDATRVARVAGPVTATLAGAVSPVVDLVPGEADDVVAVEVCPDGTIWASSLGHGVFGLSPTGAIRHHLTQEEVLPQDHVPALACDLDGSLWIGTSWGGLARRHPDASFSYHGATAGLPGDSVRRLVVVPDENGGRTLWMATDGGVARTTAE
ncbi:hypothetical protein [Vulgatibacter sp.]|uniref:hypothetical protein n=1 Tax=Vulgatibacter sp. TaxID=1971226 RepID=UPI00356AAC18